MLPMVNLLWMSLKLKAKSFLQKENGDVNVVAIVVLIGVAVLLAILFKDAIAGLINNLIDQIESKAGGAVNDAPVA